MIGKPAEACRRSASRTLAALLVLTLGACSTARFTPSPKSPTATIDHGLHAGFERVDITPPPGLGLFGHGPEGRVATGFRLRLHCRPLVLSDDTDVLALVPCDLAAISIELQRATAAKLLQRGIPIGADRLFLSATHTHAGPAHYFGARNYSGAFASREFGFDPSVLAYLSDRIADGIDSAYHRRQPACAGWGFAEIYGLTRNRSYEPFAANTTLPSALDPRGHTAPAHTTPAELAVDPLLSVLRIDARSNNACGGAVGAYAVFGMHPTAIANTSEVYHGDVFGFATRQAEALIEEGGEQGEAPFFPNPSPRIIVGLANGIEGDVSPAWDRQSPAEARRIGHLLGQRIRDVFEGTSTSPSPGPLHHRYRDLQFPNAQATHDPHERLCEAPEIGVSAAGGAEDGPTRFRALREFNEGVRLIEPRACHGTRLPLTGPDGPPTSNGIDFPAWAPIGVATVAGELVAFVPAELTTVAGLRMRERLIITSGANKTTPIVGLTNAYMQYVTTAEEYPLQHYEAASNLYGPLTATFLENHLAFLGRELISVHETRCPPQKTELNQVNSFRFEPELARIRHIPERVLDADESLALGDLVPEPIRVEGQPAFRVTWKGTSPTAMIHRQRLSVHIADETGRVIDDDRGPNFEVRYGARIPKNESEWTATWMPILRRAECPDQFTRPYNVRFEISGPVHRRSKSFAITCEVGDERKLLR